MPDSGVIDQVKTRGVGLLVDADALEQGPQGGWQIKENRRDSQAVLPGGMLELKAGAVTAPLCSGVVIEARSGAYYLLTVAHCLEPDRDWASKVRVVLGLSNVDRTVPSNLVFRPEKLVHFENGLDDRDLAIFTAVCCGDDPKGVGLARLPAEGQYPQVGDTVHLEGHPGGRARIQINGTIASLVPDRGTVRALNIDFPEDQWMCSGLSGAPIFDDRGTLIALHVGRSHVQLVADLMAYVRAEASRTKHDPLQALESFRRLVLRVAELAPQSDEVARQVLLDNIRSVITDPQLRSRIIDADAQWLSRLAAPSSGPLDTTLHSIFWSSSSLEQENPPQFPPLANEMAPLICPVGRLHGAGNAVCLGSPLSRELY